ncbi:MAG: acyl-CoA dehydrogenase, partial [Calditrichaeota bacterium]
MRTGGDFLTTPAGKIEVFSPENFSEIHREFADTAEDFAVNEIRTKRDEIEQFDRDLTRKLMKMCGDLGFLAADIPEEYGGLSAGKVTAAILVEKISRGESESFTVTFSVHTGIGILPIVYFGSSEQKRNILPKLASGEWLSAYALTEAGAGSDALALRTQARLTEDKTHYILSGNKQFISNGQWADILITFARINDEQITGFLIDPHSSGITIHEEKNKLGLHGSSTCNIVLDNVRVPADHVLGEPGEGAKIAFNSLDIGRFKLGAAVLGGCKNILERAIRYSLERRQFGQAVARFDAMKKKTAEMLIGIYALESIIYETARCLDLSLETVDEQSSGYSGQAAAAIEKFAIECSICKIVGSETYWHIADEGLQMLGGYGYIEDYGIAGMLRDTRVDRIYEGTNEINRQVIVGYFLKKTLLEELPVREKINHIKSSGKFNFTEFEGKPLENEKKSLEAAKNLFFYLFNTGLVRYGQDLMSHQQITEMFSDMMSDIFLIQTTLARIEQQLQGEQDKDILFSVIRVMISEKMVEFYGKAQL